LPNKDINQIHPAGGKMPIFYLSIPGFFLRTQSCSPTGLERKIFSFLQIDVPFNAIFWQMPKTTKKRPVGKVVENAKRHYYKKGQSAIFLGIENLGVF
jgi:hypothetical protein